MPEQPLSRHHDQSPQALIVAVQLPNQSDADIHASWVELERLANTLGIDVVRREVQKRTRTTSASYVGSGKLEELARLTGGSGSYARDAEQDIDEPILEPEAKEPIADLVLVDGELSPKQQRNIEVAMGVAVLDRTAVILRIFERRAGTKEANLEVEIARLQSELPRQRDDGSGDDRRGGGGRGERGHTNVELSKGRIRDRIAQLEDELRSVQASEASRRDHRDETFQVALVGYTNAGKSSLMRALTGSEVLVEDQLFATLGTTVRQIDPPTSPQVLISDTVGFIKNLPHELVASFQSTLDEAKYAGLLLLVVDVSDPDWRVQLQVTGETLESIGAADVPRQVVLNKIDGIPKEQQSALASEFPKAIQISALNSDDVDSVRDLVLAAQDRQLCQENLHIPFDEGSLLGEIHDHARVVEESHTERGTALCLRARAASLDRWRSMLPDNPPVKTVDDLVEMARIYGLELTTDQAKFDSTGLDYRVVFAEDEDEDPWILRAPRRPEVFTSSRVEAQLLNLVRSRLPVQIPDWKVHAEEVTAYPKVAGTPAWTIDDDGALTWNVIDPQSVSDQFSESVAKMLVALHSVPISDAKSAKIPIHTIDEVRESYRQKMIETRSVLQPNEAVWTRWSKWLDDDALWPSHRTLTHSDLHPGHMLLNADGRIIGVLDWTEAAVTDPSIDFAAYFGCFGDEALEKLLPRYEEAGGTTWPTMAEHIAERWAFNAVLVAH